MGPLQRQAEGLFQKLLVARTARGSTGSERDILRDRFEVTTSSAGDGGRSGDDGDLCVSSRSCSLARVLERDGTHARARTHMPAHTNPLARAPHVEASTLARTSAHQRKTRTGMRGLSFALAAVFFSPRRAENGGMAIESGTARACTLALLRRFPSLSRRRGPHAHSHTSHKPCLGHLPFNLWPSCRPTFERHPHCARPRRTLPSAVGSRRRVSVARHGS